MHIWPALIVTIPLIIPTSDHVANTITAPHNLTSWSSSSPDCLIKRKQYGRETTAGEWTGFPSFEDTEHRLDYQQPVRRAYRRRSRLPRRADRHDLLSLSSSLHKNLIYTLNSPSASLLIFVCVCVCSLCVVTGRHHYATQQNDAVSPLQSPHSPVSLLSSFISPPHFVSTLRFNNAAQCPHGNKGSTQTRGEGGQRGLERCELNQCNSLVLFQISQVLNLTDHLMRH